MRYIHYLILIIFISAAACSSNTKEPQQSGEENNDEVILENEAENDYEEEDTFDNEYYEKSDTDSLSERAPRIKKISVEAVSNDLTDGFLAVIETDESEDINFIYQWKHNDADIIGATEQKLEWDDQFTKGDIITLEVIPYDDLTEGIWKSEGKFRIPNSPPAITGTPPATIDGNSLNYKVEATDLDGDPLTYSLRNAPEGMTIDPETGEIKWEYGPDSAGEYKIGIEVNDGDGGQVFQDMTVTVNKGDS